MRKCLKQTMIPEYLSGTLPQHETEAFSEHLKSCATCQESLVSVENVHQTLDRIPVAKIEPDLRDEYYKRLDAAFAVSTRQPGIATRLRTVLSKASKRPMRKWQLAGTVVAIAVLILMILQLEQPESKPEIIESAHRHVFSGTMSAKDRDILIGFFLDTHALLEDIIVIKPTDINSSEHNNYKTVAQKLLIKTFVVHEIALRNNQVDLLTFMTNFELVLYELCNLSTEELIDSLSAIKQIVEDGQLLQAASKLQTETGNYRPVVQPF